MSFISLFEGEKVVLLDNKRFVLDKGVYTTKLPEQSDKQKQTEETFGFKWKQESTFDSDQSLNRMKQWLIERYQMPIKWINSISRTGPITLLDAGCGAGMSGFEYWAEHLEDLRYLGVDISEAVYVAAARGKKLKFGDVALIRSSIDNLPFTQPSFDIIFSEGVLHHTDSTRYTFNHLCKLLKPGGLFMFYVYKKKGPIREYTDDYIRNHLQSMSSEDAWKELEPLTQLGIELGKLNLQIDIPADIEILGITAGKIDIQRLFYWHVFKAFYDPKLSFSEMHHINFDWYAPQNAHRHTSDEINAWCADNNLQIEHIKEELAGITCIARKQ